METRASINDQFLSKVQQVIENNLDNENFSVEYLAQQIGLSRSMLHRKLVKLTGKCASEHITETRLLIAKSILEQNRATVSETAYKVGFKSPSYFNKVFKKHFEISPGDVKKGFETYPSHQLNETVVPEKKKQKKTDSNRQKKILFFALLFMIGLGIYILILLSDSTQKSIAVLPIHNLTGNPDNEYFAEGIHDALIGELGRISSFRVISRTSTLRYKNRDMLMKDIANELGISIIAEGSIISVGDSIRMLIQLIDVFPRERHVLSIEYHEVASKVLEVQSLIAKDIAAKINVNLTQKEKQQLGQTRLVNPESYKAYLQGMYHLNMGTNESFEMGIHYLQQAIDKDPSDPLAYAGLALGYSIIDHGQLNSEEAFIRARNAANKAIKLNPTIDKAYTAIAILTLYHDWDWVQAKSAFENALANNPNNEIAHAHFAWYYVLFGEMKKSIEHAKKAVMIEPLSAAYSARLALLYSNNHEYNKAEYWAKKALDLKEDTPYAYWVLGGVCIQRKQYQQALEFSEHLPVKGIYWKVLRGYIYTKAGQKNKAVTIWNELEKLSQQKKLNPCCRGMMAAYLGYTDKAFDLLNEAVENKNFPITYINSFPFTDAIRTDPRYKKLLSRMNLPDFTTIPLHR